MLRAWSLVIESKLLRRDLASNASASTRNGGQLPDARSGRENCFLTLPVCDKMRRVASTWRWLSTIPTHSTDSDRNKIRSSTLFVDLFPSERQRTPRGSIGKSPSFSTCLDLPSLSTYSFRQEVLRIFSGYFMQRWGFFALSRFYNVGFYCSRK